jgi:hypothetical protein
VDLIGSHLVPFLGLVLLGAVGLCGVIGRQLTAPLRRPSRDEVGGVGPTAPEDVDTE